MSLFLPVRFRTYVQLSPAEVAVGSAGMDARILEKLRIIYEGVCSRHGYIRNGSLSILRRSVGMCVKQHFNGHVRFQVVCQGMTCNPAKGMVVEAVVRAKNPLGVHAESMDGSGNTILDIIVPSRSAGILSTVSLEDMVVGDSIYVEIVGKRFQKNDRKISIIGRAVQRPRADGSQAAAAAASAAAATAAGEDEEDDLPGAEGEEDLLDLEEGSEIDEDEDEDAADDEPGAAQAIDAHVPEDEDDVIRIEATDSDEDNRTDDIEEEEEEDQDDQIEDEENESMTEDDI